jgi:hypothetical protein
MADRPYSAAGERITAILLSWQRPRNLPRIVAELARFRPIDEIIVWNNNPEARLDLPGATVINSPRNFLCFPRYCMAPLASNETIWFQDDDLLLTGGRIESVRAAYLADTSRIYGIVGRDIVNGLYSADDVYGECDIVLGRAMLFHRRLLHHAFEPFGALPPDIREDDIIFSMASPGRHFAVDVAFVEDLGSADEAAIWRRPGHFERRQRAVDFMLAWRKQASRGGGG